jgi:23S rRNA pseudouridine1911/1915/1917 synthase
MPRSSFECPNDPRVPSDRAEIPPELGGERLDSALARLLPQHSRTRIKAWIEAGAVRIGRRPGKPSEAVDAGRAYRCASRAGGADRVLPEAIALDLVHQDRDAWSSTSRPASSCIRAPAIREHTLQNALLGLDPGLARCRAQG